MLICLSLLSIFYNVAIFAMVAVGYTYTHNKFGLIISNKQAMFTVKYNLLNNVIGVLAKVYK